MYVLSLAFDAGGLLWVVDGARMTRKYCYIDNNLRYPRGSLLSCHQRGRLT